VFDSIPEETRAHLDELVACLRNVVGADLVKG
jgi:hypothetical protein